MSNSAPGRLEIVQAFINTADLAAGTDLLQSPQALVDWLSAQGLLSPEEALLDADQVALQTAIQLRDSLRCLTARNTDGEPDKDAQRLLAETSDRLHVHLRARFGTDRPLYLEADEPGVHAAFGRLLTIVFEAMLDRTWPSLKACALHSCRWAFFDRSRNHSSRWCRMEVCGNRAKVRSYRHRQSESAALGEASNS